MCPACPVSDELVAFISSGCHRVSQRQSYGDYDYSERDKLDQIIWPFSIGVSIAEEARNANAQRVGIFHIYNTPFTNEMTIFI
jgi:hypothetical protein